MELLKPKEAAEYLGIHIMSFYRLAKTGKLPAIKIGGGWRLIKDEVDKLFSQSVKVFAIFCFLSVLVHSDGSISNYNDGTLKQNRTVKATPKPVSFVPDFKPIDKDIEITTEWIIENHQNTHTKTKKKR